MGKLILWFGSWSVFTKFYTSSHRRMPLLHCCTYFSQNYIENKSKLGVQGMPLRSSLSPTRSGLGNNGPKSNSILFKTPTSAVKSASKRTRLNPPSSSKIFRPMINWFWKPKKRNYLPCITNVNLIFLFRPRNDDVSLAQNLNLSSVKF